MSKKKMIHFLILHILLTVCLMSCRNDDTDLCRLILYDTMGSVEDKICKCPLNYFQIEDTCFRNPNSGIFEISSGNCICGYDAFTLLYIMSDDSSAATITISFEHKDFYQLVNVTQENIVNGKFQFESNQQDHPKSECDDTSYYYTTFSGHGYLNMDTMWMDVRFYEDINNNYITECSYMLTK